VVNYEDLPYMDPRGSVHPKFLEDHNPITQEGSDSEDSFDVWASDI